MSADETPPDYGLIAPLAVPADSRVPDGLPDGSGPEEYDQYFRLLREQPGLLDWTRTSLRVAADLVADLDSSGLPAEDRGRILEGLLAVHRVTLERWVAAGEAARRHARNEEPP